MREPFYRKTYKNISRCVFIGVAFSLTSCMGIYEGGFECPSGKGVGCKSITDVNEMVNQGEIPFIEISEQGSEEGENKDCSCKNNPSKTCPLTSESPEIWYTPWAQAEPFSLLIGKP